MYKTSKNIIHNSKPLQNKLIVAITRRPDEIMLGEFKLYLDYSFQHEQNAPTRGIVVACCEGLNQNLMNWGTINEVMVGDEVVFSYVAAMHCWFDEPERTLMDEDDTMYFVIDYEDLFVAKRNGKIIPLNGYVLCEPVIDDIRTKLVLPDSVRTRRSEKYGRVAHVGRKNDFYQLLTEFGPEKRIDISDSQVEVGQTVVFAKNCDLMIENEAHAAIAGRNKPLYRMHQCYLLGVVEN